MTECYEAQPAEIVNADAVPAGLLEQLAAAWPNRKHVGLSQWLFGAQVQGAPTEFPAIVEQSITEELARNLRDEGRMLLTTTGPVWTRHPAATFDLANDPPIERLPQERPWKPGEPASVHDVLICRITGTSIPTLTEEPA
ncbi:MAG TPA: hypothetical protein VGL02_12365 [Streptomyces sp.]